MHRSQLILSLLILFTFHIKAQNTTRLITLDPGHFHASLVQKNSLPGLSPIVHIYAPEGPELAEHLKRINQYNSRPNSPTAWDSKVYTGPDFFQKMIAEKAGDVVVMAGNNQKKTSNILKSVQAGFHVLADKPMCIDPAGYRQLQQAFAAAKAKNVLLYDIMTERSEITTLLQKELSQIPELFGTLQKGSPDNPAIIKESVHHFFKYVSGAPLIRPAWFMDTRQQGQGIVDVTTHLVDLVAWAAYPETVLKTSDARLGAAYRWNTTMTLEQFSKITGLSTWPEYLRKDLKNNTLHTLANGEINYSLKGTHARVRVLWNYEAPQGGDTHYSIMRGTRASLEIRQTAAENFVPQLYIQPHGALDIAKFVNTLSAKYPGLGVEKVGNEWRLLIPDSYRTGHEAHFGEVLQRFLDYKAAGQLPAWEVPNMLLKYKITTEAYSVAKLVKK